MIAIMITNGSIFFAIVFNLTLILKDGNIETITKFRNQEMIWFQGATRSSTDRYYEEEQQRKQLFLGFPLGRMILVIFFVARRLRIY